MGLSGVEAGSEVLLSSGGGYFGEILELNQGCQGPFQGSRGKVGFLSSTDMDLGIPMEFPQGSQVSSCMETCKSAFLLSCKSSGRLPVELI